MGLQKAFHVKSGFIIFVKIVSHKDIILKKAMGTTPSPKVKPIIPTMGLSVIDNAKIHIISNYPILF